LFAPAVKDLWHPLCEDLPNWSEEKLHIKQLHLFDKGNILILKDTNYT
jgi:hypothetical protein